MTKNLNDPDNKYGDLLLDEYLGVDEDGNPILPTEDFNPDKKLSGNELPPDNHSY